MFLTAPLPTILAQLVSLGSTKASLGQVFASIFIIILAICAAILVRYVARRWIIVKPDEIAVFSGRSYRYTYAGEDGQPVAAKRGFRVIQGGSAFLWPVVEKVNFVSVAGFQVPIEETAIPNKDNVPINIRGVATCRLSTVSEDLANALGNFMGKSPEERNNFISEILKGHIRAVIGQLDINELLRERQAFNTRVINECVSDFRRIGIILDNLVIQDVRDGEGYIDALGKQAVAAAKRDAEIATAQAMRDTEIQKSNATREASEIKARNDASVAKAERDRDLQKAQFKTETEKARAAAESSFAIANAQQQQEVKVREASRDAASAEANTAVQEKEAQRKKKELEASKIVEAEAERLAAIIRAESAKKVAEIHAEETVLKADGERRATITEAEAEAQKRRAIAEAEATATKQVGLARADANRAELEAKAAGERAQLEAQAEGKKQSLLAEAEGQRQSALAQAEGRRMFLLAEAEGAQKMNEALAQMSESARLIIVLEKISPVITAAGDAGSKVVREVFQPIGQGLAQIEHINITDFGGGQAARQGLEGLATAVPSIAARVLAQAQLLGVDLRPLLRKLGIEADPVQLLGAKDSGGLEEVARTLVAKARRAGHTEEAIGRILQTIEAQLPGSATPPPPAAP